MSLNNRPIDRRNVFVFVGGLWSEEVGSSDGVPLRVADDNLWTLGDRFWYVFTLF